MVLGKYAQPTLIFFRANYSKKYIYSFRANVLLKGTHPYCLRKQKSLYVLHTSLKMAETLGFEPRMQVAPHNTLAGCRLQPTRPCLHLHYTHVSINNFFVKGKFKRTLFFYKVLLYSRLFTYPNSLVKAFLLYHFTACSLT